MQRWPGQSSGRQTARQKKKRPSPPPRGPKQWLSSRDVVIRAVLVGAGAFVVVFLMTGGLLTADILISDIEPNAEDFDAEDDPGLLNPLGWSFFSSHFVEVDGGPLSIDFIELFTSAAGLTFPSLVYRLSPIVILIITGYLFTSQLIERTSLSPAVVGGSTFFGYLPMCVFGVVLFSWTTTVDGVEISITVQVPEAIILAGIIYPVVCGAIGGLLATKGENRSSHR